MVATSNVGTSDDSALPLRPMVGSWCESLSLFQLSSGLYRLIFPIKLTVSVSPDLCKIRDNFGIFRKLF